MCKFLDQVQWAFFRTLGKGEANITGFPTIYFPEHVSAKCCTRVINIAIALTWTRSVKRHLNWLTCNLLWKSLQINTIARFALVGMSCFWKWITFILQMHLHSLLCANKIVRLYFISTGLILKQNAIYRKIIERVRFSRKVPVRGRFYKKGWRPLHGMVQFSDTSSPVALHVQCHIQAKKNMTLWINTQITDQSVFYVATFVWLISAFGVLWANFCFDLRIFS